HPWGGSMAVACARRVAKAQIARLGRDAAYCLIGVALALGAWAEDTNVTQPVADIEARLQRTPLAVLDMEQARPAIAEDRTVRLSLAPEEGEAPLRAKWKPVHAGGQGFNNEPRYELAAYRLQQLFLDEDEYVVPPV